MKDFTVDGYVDRVNAICNTVKDMSCGGYYQPDKEASINAIDDICDQIGGVIKDFFSSCCGAGEPIRDLYKKASPSFEKLPTFHFQDLNYARKTYIEFKQGMVDSLSKSDYDEETLRDMVGKSESFISSLFEEEGKGVNLAYVKYFDNMTLGDALANLEVLIDIYNDFNEDKNNWKEIGSAVEGKSTCRASLNLYEKTVISFLNYITIAVFRCFAKMSDAVLHTNYLISSQEKKPTTRLILL